MSPKTRRKSSKPSRRKSTKSMTKAARGASQNFAFLERLLDAAGPSGFEVRAARVWREEAEKLADEVHVDVYGNSFASLNPGGSPRVMLAGHIDEIGLQITHIDEAGYLYVAEIGGWDAQVLVG